jgi:hypothetical protein
MNDDLKRQAAQASLQRIYWHACKLIAAHRMLADDENAQKILQISESQGWAHGEKDHHGPAGSLPHKPSVGGPR